MHLRLDGHHVNDERVRNLYEEYCLTCYRLANPKNNDINVEYAKYRNQILAHYMTLAYRDNIEYIPTYLKNTLDALEYTYITRVSGDLDVHQNSVYAIPGFTPEY